MRACAVLSSLLVAATPTFAGECASLDVSVSDGGERGFALTLGRRDD